MSSRPSRELSIEERRYRDGSDPQVLDIMEVPLLSHQPDGYQQENWLLDPSRRWMKVGSVGWNQLAALATGPGQLWVNGYSTYHGRNDRVPLSIAEHLRASLTLIRVERLQLRVFNPGAAFGDTTRRVQAWFRHSGVDYALRVTDPIIERQYLAREDDTYDLGESYLTISLGEPHTDGYCYKLVAAVITRQV